MQIPCIGKGGNFYLTLKLLFPTTFLALDTYETWMNIGGIEQNRHLPKINQLHWCFHFALVILEFLSTSLKSFMVQFQVRMNLKRCILVSNKVKTGQEYHKFISHVALECNGRAIVVWRLEKATKNLVCLPCWHLAVMKVYLVRTQERYCKLYEKYVDTMKKQKFFTYLANVSEHHVTSLGFYGTKPYKTSLNLLK